MMRKLVLVALLGLVVLSAVGSHHAQAQAPQPTVRVLYVKGIIDPVTTRYVQRALGQTQASLYVIVLDTPGGSLQSMRDMVQLILGSPVPVAVYVSPPGARAGSAGTFIALAAHVAAMAPSTSIGAAHPVDASGGDIPGVLGDKVTQDAAALARSLAERYGRNAQWAEESVVKSLAITSQEALRLNVVDLLADDLPSLVAALDGRTVKTAAGEVALSTRGAVLVDTRMTPFESFLHTLVNPDIAYVLWIIGMLAIIIELYHPGAVLPGITGAICLVLAFIISESLPLNWGGIALIVLALIFFALDIKVSGFAPSVGGAIALILGSLILFSPLTPPSPTLPHLNVNRWLIAGVTAGTAALFLFALSAGVRAQRLRVPVGVQTLVGVEGIVQVDLNPSGIVLAGSESWSAVAEDPPIRAGERVVVTAVDGVKLIVRRADAPRA